MGAQCAGQKKRSESLSQEGHKHLLSHLNNPNSAEVKQQLKHYNNISQPIIFRSLKIKCSTYFALKGLEYYSKQIQDMYIQPNVQLHFILKIISYFQDDDSYTNISHLLFSAKDSYQLTLDFQNSLLRKKRTFLILKERLPQFQNLQTLTFNIGFCYIPNVTGKILFDVLPRCKKLTTLQLDFQMDVYIKARTKQSHDKPVLPNDKIACDIANCLRQCKHLKNVSLNLSQMYKEDQNYENFFKQLSLCNQLERLELILRSCKLDNANILMIGNMIIKNQQITKLSLVLDNNSFDNIHQLISEMALSSSLKKHQLIELSLICSSLKVNQEDLAEFVQNLSCFPNLLSLQFNFKANQYDKFILTQLLQSFVHNLLKIAIGKETFDISEEQKFTAILNFWKKRKKTVLCFKF